MNFRTTIILLILLLGVGAYVFFTSSGTAPDAVKNANPQRLLDLASNDVSKVVLTPADGKRIVLERNTIANAAPTIGPANSDWKLVEPIAAFADGLKVSDLIDGVVNATSTSQVPMGSNGADYGLDKPQMTVDLQAGPKSAKLDIGRQVKAGNELYVRIEGKDVAEVVSADLLDKLDTTAEKLRLARLLNADATTANWISISRPQDPLSLEKVAGNWQVSLPTTRPTTMPAESSVVTDLVSAINNAQAVGFGDASDNSDLLIGQPKATLTISNQRPTTQPSSQTETIEFGSPDSLLAKNVWVRVTPPGTLAKLARETMDGMLKSSLDLRNREVVRVAAASVVELRIVKKVPAMTQPVAIAAQLHQVVLTRRPPKKVELKAGPPAPATPAAAGGPATMASTVPATQPATHPATQPATQPVAESVWQITSMHVPADADDAKVDAALNCFNPLRADKYLASAPAPSVNKTTYLVTITLDKGSPVDMVLTDPGETATDQPVGICGDAVFNFPRSVITALDVDFAKNP